MNLEFQDDDLFSDFIIEAREHLETIEPTLLELEKAPGNIDLLNDIFRPMHSLKGASGFLGLNKINNLAHKGESVLDEMRKGTIGMNADIMDTILAVTDALSTMITTLEATNTDGDNEYQDLKDMLDAILNGEAFVAPSQSNFSEEADSVDDASDFVAESAPEQINEASASEDLGRDMTFNEWIETLEILPETKLLTFGESYLPEFIEEILENIEVINAELLLFEKDPDPSNNVVNDLFRYFHNIKGSSGIIDFKELNNLTHEAETLLNKARHGDVKITPELVDLLLFVADVMSVLVKQINVANSSVAPSNTSELLVQLQKSITGEEVALPKSFRSGKAVAANTAPGAAPAASSNVDLAKVDENRAQALSSLAALESDGSNKDLANKMHEAILYLSQVAKDSNLPTVVEYADRTANLVGQGIQADMDFSMMVDLLQQEIEITFDLFADAIKNAAPAPVAAPAPTPAQTPASAPTPAPAAQKSAEPASSAPKAEAPKAPAPEAKPATPVANSAPATPPVKASAPANAKAPQGETKAPADKTSSTIRVDHEKLDHLMNLIGELIINRNRYNMIARQLEESTSDPNIALVAQNLSETTYGLARISDELQDTIMKVRMVPVSSVFARFPRMVRDLSRKSNKDVQLIMEGEETELDKSVVEVIGDPLVHLIRNSMDHGIEPADVRIAAGKPAQGKVVLRAYHKGNSVYIEIEDDGKGIDPEKMRSVAVSKGLLTAEDAKNLDDREAVDLIFAPGFSSAAEITDISGRGVGMDVVKTNIKNLKGSITTTTELGKGTRFSLSLPLTLAIIDALIVNVSDQIFAIPLDAVSETTKIEKAILSDIKGRKAVTLRGEVLGLIELSEILNIEKSYDELPEMLSVVILQDGGKRLGLVVDSLLERQEIVIKPLGAYLHDLKGISGATIMGDGSVLLILDPHEVYSMSTA